MTDQIPDPYEQTLFDIDAIAMSQSEISGPDMMAALMRMIDALCEARDQVVAQLKAQPDPARILEAAHAPASLLMRFQALQIIEMNQRLEHALQGHDQVSPSGRGFLLVWLTLVDRTIEGARLMLQLCQAHKIAPNGQPLSADEGSEESWTIPDDPTA